ncbi:MAG: helix-turn-helix domain-containing protein [Spirochaetaceae bacterium]|nr:helix-turn-helix domain-containing protein [Spirochaetaceae bacterium]
MLERRGPASVGGRILLIPASSGSGLPNTKDSTLIRKIRLAHDRGDIIASVCAGAAWIAAAGIDEGRPLTTHWNLAPALAAMRPDIDVVASELVIDHGDIVSAGGLLAWVDLGLHLARRFWGSAVADEVARVLVWDGERRSQLPFSPPGSAWVPLRRDPSLERAIAWARGKFTDSLSLEEWARGAALGLRTLQRRWAASFGESPLRWLQAVRIEEARRLLENSLEPWESITARCGYSDPASFREMFARRIGTTPGRYRKNRPPKRP